MTRDVPDAELRAARRGAERKAFELRNGGLPEDAVWWLHRRTLPDGRVLYLTPYGAGLLYVQVSPDSRAMHFTDTWCYAADAHEAAWRAVLGWDGEGEPDGWFRHPQSGRRWVSEPEPVPADPAERTLLSLQSRWAHDGCSREQIASEALDIIRDLTLNACAERALASVQIDRLSARVDEYARGVVADDLLRTLERQNNNQAGRIRELEKHLECWHCQVELLPAEPPHCMICPGFECCDAPACTEPGCAERTGQSDDD